MGEYHYGDDFSYDVWSAGTEVELCNVPWDADYRNIVDFSNPGALKKYCARGENIHVRVDRVSYVRAGGPVRLEIPFNDAYRFNYMHVYNPAQPVGEKGPRDFFYFITDVRHIAPSTTEFVVQLDVWNSFRWDMTFGRAFVERGHALMTRPMEKRQDWLENLCVPEGFDLGNEYSVYWGHVYQLAKYDNEFGIIAWSTIDLSADHGTIDNPKVRTAKGSHFEGLPNGCSAYYFPTLGDWMRFCAAMQDTPWVTQGIVTVQAVPNVLIDKQYLIPVKDNHSASWFIMDRGSSNWLDIGVVDNVSKNIGGVLPDRYKKLEKFRTYPYFYYEATMYTGTPLVLKPERLNNSRGQKKFVPHNSKRSVYELSYNIVANLSVPGTRIVAYPQNYNRFDKTGEVRGGRAAPNMSVVGHDKDSITPDDGGDFLDTSTGAMNMPTFSVTNNSYLNYLASNTHSIAYSHSSADWSQNKALRANSVAFDNSMTGIGASNAQTAESNRYAGGKALLSAGTSAVGGLASLARGDVGGAVKGGVDAALTGVNYSMDTTHRNNANTISTGATREVADRNRSYADWASRGDYENTIGAINAKVQDAQLIPPTTSGQVGGEGFMMAFTGYGVTTKLRGVSGSALRAIGEHWLRYGYATNRYCDVKRCGISVMSRFTYWKMEDFTVVSSMCPETFRNAVRGIFEKGVTVWRSPADIGNVDFADNDPTTEVKFEDELYA